MSLVHPVKNGEIADDNVDLVNCYSKEGPKFCSSLLTSGSNQKTVAENGLFDLSSEEFVTGPEEAPSSTAPSQPFNGPL